MFMYIMCIYIHTIHTYRLCRHILYTHNYIYMQTYYVCIMYVLLVIYICIYIYTSLYIYIVGTRFANLSYFIIHICFVQYMYISIMTYLS